MYSLVYITAGNKKEAQKIAETLIKERLAACVNFFSISSIYRWKGKVERAKEIAIFAKTKSKLVGKIIKVVKKIHSYEVPCIISLPVKKGDLKFLKWIDGQTS